MKLKYRNKLSIPFLIGLWCLLYIFIYISLIVLILSDGYSGEPEKMGYFILFSIGCFFVLISSPAVMLKWDWGRKLLSLGFHLAIIILGIAFVRAPSTDTVSLFLLFVIPVIPVLLLLHSETFINYFSEKKEKSYNEVTPLDQNSASRKSGK